MELQQIRSFLAVANELHFGRAAERLHIAQPPLSRTIKNLERELGALLFERSTRNVKLTTAGQALMEPAEEIMAACRRAKAAVASAGKGESGRVRFAFAGVSSHVMVGKLAKLVRQTHPGIDMELYSSYYAVPALNEVIAGTMDIGLGRWNFLPAGIESRTVARETLVIAVPANHRLVGRESVSMADLARESMVALPPDPGAVLRDHLDRLSHKAGFVPSIVQVAPDTSTLLSLVAAEIGCALTVSSVPANVSYPGVEFLDLSDPVDPIELQLIWRDDDSSPALREVLRLSDAVFPSPAADPEAVTPGST
ncbi:LysR substrate-binding domain-containing protein [Arthrobacter monumenti]